MPQNARVYIGLILCSGAAVLIMAVGWWSSANMPQFLALLSFAALTSTLKIHIPGIEGTMSPNFLFLVLGMAVCSFSEVLAIALASALVQSLWTAKRPRLIQVMFNAAALVLSAAVAQQCAYLLFGPHAIDSPVAVVILAGSLYLSFNTVLMSAVIGLVNGKPVLQVGRVCFECVFPYFMIGILFAGLVSGAFSRSRAWNGAIVLFPVVVLGYVYSRSRAANVMPAAVLPATSLEDEELVELGS